MYEGTTYNIILNRMLGRVPDSFDKREGSVIWDTHSPAAIEFQNLYIELDHILKEAYGDTASREYLILRCKERGITPYPATHAVLKGVFTPKNLDMAGKRFNIGEMNYVVTEKITDGEYQVQCETAGSIGNQYFGALTPIEYVAGLASAELTALLIPGEDEEDTEVLRRRYFDSFEQRAFGGNVQDYLEKTNAIPGVGAVKVTRVWNTDISPENMIPTAAVTSWYTGIVNTLATEVSNWLTAVYTAASEKKLTTGGTVLLTILNAEHDAASDTLVNTVQEVMDPPEYTGEGLGLAPIGHIVTVKSAESVPVTVQTELVFETGYSWSNLQELLDAAIQEYLLELRKVWADSPYLTVRISQIETRLLAVQGVVDISNTKLNGIESNLNLVLGEYEIPTFGGVSA